MTEAELYYINYEQFEELMINENLKIILLNCKKKLMMIKLF